jgi:hypothetical protein
MHSSVHILILSKPMRVLVSIPETSALSCAPARRHGGAHRHAARTRGVAGRRAARARWHCAQISRRQISRIAHSSIRYDWRLYGRITRQRESRQTRHSFGRGQVEFVFQSANAYIDIALLPLSAPTPSGLYHKADPKQHAPLHAYATSLTHRVVVACERAIAAALRGLALSYAQPATAAAIHTAADNTSGGGGFAAESVVFFLKMYARGLWFPPAVESVPLNQTVLARF